MSKLPNADDIKKQMAPEILSMEELIRNGKEELNKRAVEKNTCTQAEFIKKWVILFKKEYQEDYKAGKVVPQAFTDAMEGYVKRFNLAMPVIIKLPNGQVDFIPPAITPINLKFNPQTIIAMTNAMERAGRGGDPFAKTSVDRAIASFNQELVDNNFASDSPDSMQRKRAVLTGRAMVKRVYEKINESRASSTDAKSFKADVQEDDDWDDDETEVF